MHKLEKSNERILRKSKKVHFWALFAQIWANKNFSKKSGSVTFEPLCTLTSCKISEKSNEPIQRKVGYRRTDSTEFIGPSGYANKEVIMNCKDTCYSFKVIDETVVKRELLRMNSTHEENDIPFSKNSTTS